MDVGFVTSRHRLVLKEITSGKQRVKIIAGPDAHHVLYKSVYYALPPSPVPCQETLEGYEAFSYEATDGAASWNA